MTEPSDRADWAEGSGRYSSGYDHDPRHFHFQRSHTGDLEHSRPLSGWGYDVLSLAGIVALVALLWAFAWCLS